MSSDLVGSPERFQALTYNCSQDEEKAHKASLYIASHAKSNDDALQLMRALGLVANDCNKSGSDSTQS